MKFLFSLLTLALLTSCVSLESSIKNIDNTAIRPAVKNNAYVITEYAEDSKYAFHPDYPINIGLILEKQENQHVEYYFNGLTGPNGEKISFKKVDTCCPYPTKNNTMGAGTINIYEVTFEGSSKKHLIYINIFEKGKIVCPNGFLIKKPIEIIK